ncbi:MAG: hypothetical protein JO000_13555 [Alphaproteobacteria bacterium]|nr:hypothetical protein [Alphaproteobacteria bacterium]
MIAYLSRATPNAIATIALALGLILLAFGCGMVLQAHLAGHASAWRLVLPLTSLVLGFVLLAAKVWTSRR